jgi:DNA-directed RNA polymerase subunit F
MKASTFKKNMRMIRNYAKLYKIKIVLSAHLDPEDDCYLPYHKRIQVSKNQKPDRIINILLHEIGHHHDDSLHPKEAVNPLNLRALGKNSALEQKFIWVKRQRIKLANRLLDPVLKKAVMNLAYGKKVALYQQAKIDELREDLISDLSARERKLLRDARITFYQKFYLTFEEKEALLLAEKRAWEYGEQIGKMLSIKFSKSFYKDRAKSLTSYSKNSILIGSYL